MMMLWSRWIAEKIGTFPNTEGLLSTSGEIKNNNNIELVYFTSLPLAYEPSTSQNNNNK